MDDPGEDATRSTPMAHAALEGHLEVVDRLLEAGAEVDARNRSDVTPLMLAARGGEPSVVRMLLDAGADPATADEEGLTAGDHARQRAKWQALALLGTAHLVRATIRGAAG